MKKTYQDFRAAMDKIPTAGMQGHYVLGTYEVILADLAASLPKARQEDLLRQLDSLRARVETIDSGY